MRPTHTNHRGFLLRSSVAVLLCTAALALPEAVFADDHFWQTLSKLEFPQNTRTAFSEARKTRLQLKAKTQSGVLWLSSDNVLVMSIEKPRAELRTISATQLSIERGNKTRSLSLDPTRAAHQLPLIIVDVLRGDLTRLRNGFRVAPTQEKVAAKNSNQTESWSMRLVPVERALKKQLTALMLSGEGDRLLTLRTERGSSYQEITILAEPAPGK